MKREIKFRTWNIKQNRMSNTPARGTRTWLNAIFTDENMVFMQYTGLKDKNDVPIYEGDICRVTRKDWKGSWNPKEIKTLKDNIEIYWDKERNSMSSRTIDLKRYGDYKYSSSGYLGSKINDDRAKETTVEIIGNIYEHPDLLK